MSSKYEFEKSVVNLLEPLQSINRFYDCQLMCLGGEAIFAHRILLSMHSLYFKDWLARENRQGLPVIDLKGIELGDLKLVIDLMYVGRVTVPLHQQETFLELLDSFRIRNVHTIGNIHKINNFSKFRT